MTYTKTGRKFIINTITKQCTISVNNTDVDSKINCSLTKTNLKVDSDSYTIELLREQYSLHKTYVSGRIDTIRRTGVKFRLPAIPEDISENIIKYIINFKVSDLSSRWDCIKGDLYSEIEGKQECKCFTSDGPISFTPVGNWDTIYFLDARNWLNDKFILYKVELKASSYEWKNIKINKNQTFEDQCIQKRRPRISWDYLYPQVYPFCIKVYDGTFDNIFSY